MKYAKMLGLLAVAAAALMAFAGVASASTLTSPAGTAYTSTIEAASEGTTELHNSSLGITVACTASTVKGKVETHGAGVNAGGKISSLTFTNCGTNHVSVKNAGSLAIDSSGTVTSSGAEITIQSTSIGISCTYTTSGTDVGTLTESSTTKGKATLDINSATIPRTGHSFFCGSKGQWTGSYVVNTPSFLDVS